MNLFFHVTLLNIAISSYYDKYFSFKVEVSIVHEIFLLSLKMIKTMDTYSSPKQKKFIHQYAQNKFCLKMTLN